MNEPIKVSDESFQKEVVESNLPVLVISGALVRSLPDDSPDIDEFPEYAGKVKVVKLNTDENPTLP